jgi:hypothetical protein
MAALMDDPELRAWAAAVFEQTDTAVLIERKRVVAERLAALRKEQDEMETALRVIHRLGAVRRTIAAR